MSFRRQIWPNFPGEGKDYGRTWARSRSAHTRVYAHAGKLLPIQSKPNKSCGKTNLFTHRGKKRIYRLKLYLKSRSENSLCGLPHATTAVGPKKGCGGAATFLPLRPAQAGLRGASPAGDLPVRRAAKLHCAVISKTSKITTKFPFCLFLLSSHILHRIICCQYPAQLNDYQHIAWHITKFMRRLKIKQIHHAFSAKIWLTARATSNITDTGDPITTAASAFFTRSSANDFEGAKKAYEPSK